METPTIRCSREKEKKKNNWQLSLFLCITTLFLLLCVKCCLKFKIGFKDVFVVGSHICLPTGE